MYRNRSIRRLLSSCAAVVAIVLISANRPADAAAISSIHYDITGGAFAGFLFEGYFGPITGVSVTYTPPGGTVSTPHSCRSTAGCGRLDFVMTGPSVTPSASPKLYVDLNTVYIESDYFFADYTFPVSGYPTLWWVIQAPSGLGSGHTGLSSSPTSLATTYTIGNEVRVLPEPSNAVALAFGGVLLIALSIIRASRSARQLG